MQRAILVNKFEITFYNITKYYELHIICKRQIKA